MQIKLVQNKIFNIALSCTQSKLLLASNMALIIRFIGVKTEQRDVAPSSELF